jgi:predicted nucleotidyltransferase
MGSGRFLLRIDPEEHRWLRDAARAAGVSLNEYCARRLAIPAPAGDTGLWAVAARAWRLLGDELAGVVVFGSYARDAAVQDSDIDLLVVLGEGGRVTRELYRRWDDAGPLRVDGRAVDAHFVSLPGVAAPLTGLWAEVSIDGLVLYDRDLALSRRLAAYRSAIAAGAMERRWAHGQPYWVAA